ncbi:vascular-related unknown protein 1-like [Solanum dulcamara]|uniref:vascular-related unknown protein 1-like n=1 Tax=Solanum dulcamara TaxID=45834 RepID=UPI002485D8AA|nr:vascular-related unknown protein 1-like [Solanum dulcamara]
MNQSEYKSSSSTNEDEQQEESGWTTYLEDFSLMNNQRETYDNDDDNFGPNYSLLSDASSNISPWKHNYCNTNYNQLVASKKLHLKKLPRNKKINDPDLEDTASSPINSPKVNNFKKMEINYRRKENCTGNFMGNEGSSRQFQEVQKVERGNVSLDKINGYTDLKKKGLCLVPLSMLVNYHG